MGYLDRYGSLHPSSLSGLVRAIETLVDARVAPARLTDVEPVSAQPRITAEEEAAILARADEVNARVARILEDYG
ncbi:hypothetical protein [Amycolatopsis sp. cmx-11-12]|uniref:hypothetical protein n=1 Tax=Amycolatopsis sp. cmx-11-12 TaxID=2785795 RepID=UPI003917DC99